MRALHAASNLTRSDSETAQGRGEHKAENSATPKKRQRQPNPLPKPLKDAIKQDGRMFRTHFGPVDRIQARRAGRLLARILCPGPGPGRPKKPHVSKAMRLEKQGQSRKDIYRLCGADTPAEQKALRDAMRQRKFRKRRRAERRAKRDKPLPPVTPTN